MWVARLTLERESDSCAVEKQEESMRGSDLRTGELFSYVDLEQRVPESHPLRLIRCIVNQVLAALDGEFGKLYAAEGRPSIAPERLLRALLLQAFYSIRSERQLMEQLHYNLLYRWFVGLGVDDRVWVPTVFTKNRDRLLEAEVARKFLAELLAHRQVRALLSDDHFSVDGTQVQAWASMKSFVAKDGSGDPPSPGRNGERGTRPVQGLLERLTLGLGHLGAAASGRRQARDDFRFPLNHLGIRARLTLRKHLLDKLNRPLNLLVRHRLDAAGMLQLHLPRHQQGAYLHVGSGLLLTHLRNGFRTVTLKVGSEREQEILVKRPTRSLQGTARVSFFARPPPRGLSLTPPWAGASPPSSAGLRGSSGNLVASSLSAIRLAIALLPSGRICGVMPSKWKRPWRFSSATS